MPRFYSVTLPIADDGEIDLGDEVLDRDEAVAIARAHEGAQVWAHGRYPRATRLVRWRVRHA